MARLIFITGTDTGVGKTVLTALLLCHWRAQGCDALAIKPFCSGSRSDALLLHRFEKNLLTLDEVNPFFFDQPIAPGAAEAKKEVPLDKVLVKIQALAARCGVLLIEGAGGLLVPLGRNYTVADLISHLGCTTVVVSRNSLGTLNHTLLTAKALQSIGIQQFTVALMEDKKPDISARTNPALLRKMIPSARLISIPHLGSGASNWRAVKKNALFLKKTLAQFSSGDSLSPFFQEKGRKG